MNIDTDTQWAYWDGVRKFEADKHAYLQGQIGNPEGDHVPNKVFTIRAFGYAREKNP